MPIECMSSNLSSDVRCDICGQGFLVYAEHRMGDTRQRVLQALRLHHTTSEHPSGPFTIDCTPEPIAAFCLT